MVGVEGCCVGSSCLAQTKFQAQVDSGTSFTFLPTKVYGEVVSEEQENSGEKQVNYQCRCSFMERNLKVDMFGQLVTLLSFPLEGNVQKRQNELTVKI
ncbi:aspartic proteinase-like protein 1 isoform X1 [Papaver somniferum]|uniref:aspartic proteinase-like protein 1 isoform X1 n=1 Tax=Papaver somniferum TaxID=3469 RepID=UPI000E6F4EEA|nr:aspartic proteinase-like protein 1 isoform X1 [Papaver somniferum]